MTKHLDRLTGQLYHLPTIIGRLGLSIAEAQKELNADYLRNIGELIRLIKNTIAQLEPDAEGNKDKLAAFQTLLEALAPPRYQFSETTLEFSADLAEHLSLGAEVGASVGIPAVTVNAALSVGYGRDYRAAARVSTVLHAYQNNELAKDLLARAESLQADKVSVPERAKVDDEIWTRTAEVFKAISGQNAEADAPPTPKPATS